MRRGENEEVLSLHVVPPEEEVFSVLDRLFVKGSSPASEQVREAMFDSFKRLLFPSMETEIRTVTKKGADEEAIRVFAENLRQLLLASPLGRKTVLAIDPGFRTGCKVLCLDRQGNLLHRETVFPHQSEREAARAGETLRDLCARFQVEAIAIGNGTAGRETETFVKRLDLPVHILVVMVNESGASVYSASDAAREEFPDEDVTVRGAVSIGRRLMDPLAELVKSILNR
jgi:Transcriptional accessory protein